MWVAVSCRHWQLMRSCCGGGASISFWAGSALSAATAVFTGPSDLCGPPGAAGAQLAPRHAPWYALLRVCVHWCRAGCICDQSCRPDCTPERRSAGSFLWPRPGHRSVRDVCGVVHCNRRGHCRDMCRTHAMCQRCDWCTSCAAGVFEQSCTA